MKLGNNIYALRTRKGLSQGDLAEALDVSRQSISKWEVGGATPDLDKLLALSDLFGITLDELVRGEISVGPPAVVQDAAESSNEPPLPTTDPNPSGSHSTMKIVLITGLVILGVLALPSLFFSPKAWPGLLILLILGSLGFALWTRGQDNRNHPENQGDQKQTSTSKNQLLKILLITGVLLLPVFGLANSLPKGPVYAKAGRESTLSPQDYSGARFASCSGQGSSVSYVIVNETDETLSYDASAQRIEVKKNETWYELKRLTDSDGIHRGLLPPGKPAHIYISCEELYGKLPVGEYRVLLRVYPLSESGKAQWIAKEFTIQAAFQLP